MVQPYPACSSCGESNSLLRAENNLLRTKFDILLDTVSIYTTPDIIRIHLCCTVIYPFCCVGKLVNCSHADVFQSYNIQSRVGLVFGIASHYTVSLSLA